MMKRERLFGITLAICLSVGVLVFLGSSAAEAGNYKKMSIKIAHAAPPSDPRHLSAVTMKETIEKESDGLIKVDIYPAAQLGGGREQIEATQAGGIEICILPTPFLGGFQPLMTVLDVPYFLPQNHEAARKLIHGSAGKALLKTLDAKNIVGLAFWDSAYKHFMANKPLRQLADYKDMKFRVMPSKILIQMIKSLGASAITLPYKEVYTALQTGAIDGQETSLVSAQNMKFYEVQKVVSKTYHIKSIILAMASKKWFDTLNSDTQALIRKAAAQSALKTYQDIVFEKEKQAEAIILKSGTEILDLTDKEIDGLRQVTRQPCLDVYLKANGEAGKKIVEAFK